MLLDIHTGDMIAIPVKVVGTRTGMSTPTEYAVEFESHKFWISEKKLLDMGFYQNIYEEDE